MVRHGDDPREILEILNRMERWDPGWRYHPTSGGGRIEYDWLIQDLLTRADAKHIAKNTVNIDPKGDLDEAREKLTWLEDGPYLAGHVARGYLSCGYEEEAIEVIKE